MICEKVILSDSAVSALSWSHHLKARKDGGKDSEVREIRSLVIVFNF